MKPLNVKLTKSPQSSFKYKHIALDAFEFNWHCHPEYELMLMLNSRGKRFVGDSIAFYDPGDLFMIGPNLPHTWYGAAGKMGKKKTHEAILVQFMGNFAGLDVSTTPEFKAVNRLFENASLGLRFHGDKCKLAAEKMVAMEHADSLDRLIMLMEVLNILSKAEKETQEILSSIEFKHRFQPGEQSRIDRVCTYINRNYRNSLRLEDAARIANMSVTAFSRFFKKSTGKTFVQYVNELRIGQACRMLIESEMNIAEICYEVGFNNISNFNRRFCERQNMSPRRFRQEFAAKY